MPDIIMHAGDIAAVEFPAEHDSRRVRIIVATTLITAELDNPRTVVADRAAIAWARTHRDRLTTAALRLIGPGDSSVSLAPRYLGP